MHRDEAFAGVAHVVEAVVWTKLKEAYVVVTRYPLVPCGFEVGKSDRLGHGLPLLVVGPRLVVCIPLTASAFRRVFGAAHGHDIPGVIVEVVSNFAARVVAGRVRGVAYVSAAFVECTRSGAREQVRSLLLSLGSRANEPSWRGMGWRHSRAFSRATT
jgi:hypothetical protein